MFDSWRVCLCPAAYALSRCIRTRGEQNTNLSSPTMDHRLGKQFGRGTPDWATDVALDTGVSCHGKRG